VLCNGSLRRKQVERALAGSDTMLIWLGKQRLGQNEKTETDHHNVGFGLGTISGEVLASSGGKKPY
jgi:hypothetical protein